MQYKITTDESLLVHTVHALAVCDWTATYAARVPEHEARAKRIAAEASRWLAFATARTRLTPQVLTAKALDSVAFSVAAGAAGFAVPSKLVGVKPYQRALWTLVRDGYRVYDEFETDTATTEGVRVSYGDVLVGEVQTKHLGWVRPLVPFGLTVHLARVTGSETEGRTLGVNVVFGHIAPAIAALTEALGMAATACSGSGGEGASGDGSGGLAAAAVFPAPALPRRTSGDGAPGRLRLILRPGIGTGTAPRTKVAGLDDIVLYRDTRGTAYATVAHVPVHSTTGIDWGRLGAGPTDLAISVLTAVASADAAESHSAAFADEVIAHLPFAGGVLRAARVRDWLARQQA
ncbi:MAG TPA: DUF6166 domain-containing protein [Rubricoccaceae bacterium]|jgi:hypothetical protein